jgi:tight adherence protein C
MNEWFLILMLLTSLGAVLILFELTVHGKDIKASERFDQIFKIKRVDKSKASKLLSKWLAPGFVQGSEFGHLLIQTGLDTPYARWIFWFVGRIVPALAAIFTFFILLGLGESYGNALLKAVFTFAFIFVGSNMVLRWRAAVVARAIVKELIPFLHMLRMLFNAGMSLENALIILVEQSGDIFPHLQKQLQRVLFNLHAGQDQADALMHMAELLDIQEVTDAVSILYQVSKYGGNVQSSLSSYIELIEIRQFSSLREQVSKLSAKMSIVMIIFMFPALIIFIAGPGFIGIADALNGI